MARLNSNALIVGVATALAGSSIGLAVIFANAGGTAAVAEQAAIQVRAESVLGAASASRLLIEETLVFSAAEEIGVLPADRLAAVKSRARQALNEVHERIWRLRTVAGSVGELETAALAYRQAGEEALDGVDRAKLVEAREIVDEELTPAYVSLVEAAEEIRNRQAVAIAVARADAGRVANGARFMVAFLIPAFAIFVYWELNRRRRTRGALEAALASEREVSRSKDEFISNLSHELRTPLTAIYGFALAMEEEGFDNPDVLREMNAMIVREAAELTRMVEDLLTAARADVGALTMSIEEADVIAETRAVLEPLWLTGEKVGMDCEPASVQADRLRLRQALRNLVANAIKHGGRPVGVVGRVEEEKSAYQLVVVDHGPGVPPDLESRLFERFVHRGDQPLMTGSVGLGLSIARLLTETMGGQIIYERREGVTYFGIQVPMIKQDEDARRGEPVPTGV